MTYTITRPRTVARAATIALWAVGSAYLIRHELAAASPDPVVIASTPVVWGVVISLPILATYARQDRQWVAMALIWLAALVGSAYTLHATFGRQASARDTAVATAEHVITQRQEDSISTIDEDALHRQLIHWNITASRGKPLTQCFTELINKWNEREKQLVPTNRKPITYREVEVFDPYAPLIP
jgi:hypothetical protein